MRRKIISHGIDRRAFKPVGVPRTGLETVYLTLDGLEAIRLADGEGLYQEAAAERMDVSRTTFSRILAAARRAVAEALLEGKALEIRGGVVDRSPAGPHPCPVHGGVRRTGRGCRCGPRDGHGRGMRADGESEQSMDEKHPGGDDKARPDEEESR
ncbi:MAG: DUF134 domain-containing protein [Candidatus Eisenbacteria bacterium]|nr:DUF134 domain-containing protein [Candidatus Eisenbacteria bacterium]